MSQNITTTALADSHCAKRWAEADLPDAWPDSIDYQNPRELWALLRAVLGKKTRPVLLPEGLPGAERLPRYVLQEFHHLPNGNYSRTLAAGYARWFDRVMLGSLHSARAEMAAQLAGCERVLDIGSGGGHTAGALLAAQIPEVWALEPSPYLLQVAARAYPALHCAQGVIEQTAFPEQHFDAASACFVFHEIPPRYADRALTELQRILKPGAKLVIVEPSPSQWFAGYGALWRRYGWRGMYFRVLAKRVFEPFTAAWHERDLPRWFEQHGFTLIVDEDRMPYRRLIAQRQA